MPTLYRIVDVFPYLDREDEYPGLTLSEAAAKIEDLTPVGADVVLTDWDEPCDMCQGLGTTIDPTELSPFRGFRRKRVDCPHCGGDGFWPGPWKWTNEETGREVTMMREVG